MRDTGFSLTEKDRHWLRGLFLPHVISFEQQYARFRLVCQNYSGLFRRPRGIYFSAKDKGEMTSMIYNWPAQQVDMIVLTDGSRILGLGDLRVQGIAILIGKLDMYVAAASINPQRSFTIIFCCFVCPFPLGFISHIFCLSSSARLGVLSMAVQTVAKMIGQCETAAQNFFLLDEDGLITKEMKNLYPAAAPFAKDPGQMVGLREGASLLEVVKKVKPDVLLGLSGVGGVFNEEVLKAMHESGSSKLVIFAMSNPTMNAECTAADAFKLAGENIVFASGGLFENVILGNGKVGHVNQANNMYLFSGLVLFTLFIVVFLTILRS
ncbi:hypothetical protein REPUB_Repub16aG0069500 [Reevesia pubescens]